MTSEWTEMITERLRAIGDKHGFDTGFSGKQLTLKNGLKIKPDVVWKKGEEFKFIFEIDIGAYDIYPKTIYGSMLTGNQEGKIKG